VYISIGKLTLGRKKECIQVGKRERQEVEKKKRIRRRNEGKFNFLV